ncbi:MAG: CPBP family intramembrane metalloprotease [Bacteroidetes bacterium]|nr:CPBP family intramembrane metalloprotease [Bacteroidota bacterium]
MPNQIIIFLFSIVGIVLFFVRFQKLKRYFSTYADIFGIVAILYIISILVGHYFYNLDLDLYIVLMAIIGFIRNAMVASLATFYFYDEFKIMAVPFLFKLNGNKISTIKIFHFSIIALLLIIICSMIFISLSNNAIFDFRDFSWDVGLYTMFNSFIVAFNEEMFVRLFMFGAIAYWLRNAKGNFIIAAILSSLLWSLDHFLVDVMAMKFIFLFLMGLLLSFLMYKKGIESCIVVHGIYNTLAFLVLGYMN